MSKIQIKQYYGKESDNTINLYPESKHETIPAPEGKYKPDTVWVMGAEGIPVRLYSGEFKRL